MLQSIPPPPGSSFDLGPLTVRFYALCILAGIVLAWWLGSRRFKARGGQQDDFDATVLWAVLIGVLGARLYHIITDYQLYFGPGREPIRVLYIWEGGLGIWGGIALGAVAVWVICRRRGLDFGSFADVLAPTLLFAQAIGRVGNWFNQELFGRPTTVPWALEVDPQYRPAGFESNTTFHPTFAYEGLWNVIGGVVLLLVEKRFKLGRGKLFVSYLVWYTFGRFWIEALRIDPANHVGGFRINNVVALVVFVAALLFFAALLSRRPGVMVLPFGVLPPSGATPARTREPRCDVAAAGDENETNEADETSEGKPADGNPQ